MRELQPLLLLIGVSLVFPAFGQVPNEFNPGQTLTAESLNENFSNLNSRTVNNTNQINTLDGEVNGIDSRVTANSDNITANSRDITANSDDITTNTNAIGSANTRINGNVTNINNNSDAINALDSRVTTLEQTGNVNARLNQAEQDINTLQTDVNTLDNRVTNLENNVSNNSANISTLNDNVNANSNDITTLQGAINNPNATLRQQGFITQNPIATETVVIGSNGGGDGEIVINQNNGLPAVVIDNSDGFGTIRLFSGGVEGVRFQGNGTKNFVMTHPSDETKQIIYNSLEGPEAAMYIRGTAQLVNGHAIVQLPEHFALIASPDGMTAQLTPHSAQSLGVARTALSPQQLEIRELGGGQGNYSVDYSIYAVRKGFENFQPVQDRK